MTEHARVSLPEADLLAVARALVSPDAYHTVEATLASSTAVTKIGPSAMAVLKSTLARGVVKTLARLGGARARIRPDTGLKKTARVFEVRAVPELSFSSYSFELVRWLTNTALGSRDSGPRFTDPARTLGDELCAYLALRLVEGERLERVVASAPALRTPLTWLGFARALARHGDEKVVVPSLESLVADEDGRTVIESLGGDLARRWTDSVLWDEYDVIDAEHAVRISTLERAVLDGFLDAIEKKERLDLATFLIEAASRALPPGAKPRDIAARAAPRVRPEGTLRARTESRRRAGALFHALTRLGRKREELAHIGFIDDGYDVAQATLSSWEFLARDTFTRAENVVTVLGSLEDLGTTPGVEPAPI